jgi:hypothetical protein
MNVIEQTVKAQNGAIDLHIPVPENLEGYLISATVYDLTEPPDPAFHQRQRFSAHH